MKKDFIDEDEETEMIEKLEIETNHIVILIQ